MARSFGAADSLQNPVGSRPFVITPGTIGTVGFWHNPTWSSGDSTTHGMWTILASGSGVAAQITMFHFSDNNIYIGWQNNVDGTNRLVVADTGIFTAGTWKHHIFRWDSSITSQNYWVNAVQKATDAVHPGPAYVQVCDTISLAFSSAKGVDFCYWNVWLTQAEMSALAAGARANTIRPANIGGYAPIDGLNSPEPVYGPPSGAVNLTITGTAFATPPSLALATSRRPAFSPFTSAPVLPLMPSMPDLTTPVRFRTRMVGY